MNNFDKIVYCFYCAYEGRLIEFRFKTKKGISTKYFECPDCHNIMLRTTLLKEITPSEWAKVIYANIRQPFNIGSSYYDKIQFQKLIGRLKKYGMAMEFWNAWKEAKEISAEELRRILSDFYYVKDKQTKLVPLKEIKI